MKASITVSNPRLKASYSGPESSQTPNVFAAVFAALQQTPQCPRLESREFYGRHSLAAAGDRWIRRATRKTLQLLECTVPYLAYLGKAP